MKNIALFISLLNLTSFTLPKGGDEKENERLEEKKNNPISCVQYESEVIQFMISDSLLNPQAVRWAYQSYLQLKQQGDLKNDEILTIIDFSQPSDQKRAYIYDLKNQRLIYQKRVAHGMKTGTDKAKYFSNRSGSHQSSFGAYVTSHTYHGKFDLALRLEGMEYSNSQANARGIVVHAAQYATEKFLKSNGRLGRSFGCPAFPFKDFEEIVDLIKDGSCFYIYYPDPHYSKRSQLLQPLTSLTED